MLFKPSNNGECSLCGPRWRPIQGLDTESAAWRSARTVGTIRRRYDPNPDFHIPETVATDCLQCLPEDRNYEKGEKCYECIQRGAECGPNVRCRRHGGGGGGGDGPSSQRAPAPPRSAPPPPAPETEALPTTANYANQSSAVIPSTVDSSIRGPRLNANVSLPRNVDPGVAHGLSELSDTEGPSHPSPKCSSRFARRLVEKSVSCSSFKSCFDLINMAQVQPAHPLP